MTEQSWFADYCQHSGLTYSREEGKTMAQTERIETAISKTREQLEIIAEETRLMLIERAKRQPVGVTRAQVRQWVMDWDSSADDRPTSDYIADRLSELGFLLPDAPEQATPAWGEASACK